MEGYSGIFVFAEPLGDSVHDVTLELLGCAQKLALRLNCEISAVFPSDGTVQPWDQLARYGADRIIALNSPELSVYRTLPFTRALQAAVEKYKPEIVLFGATPTGRDLAPRLSARLRTGLTADCTGLAVDEDSSDLIMTRPAFGGNLMAEIQCSAHRPQMATVRPGVMQKNEKAGSPAVETIEVEIPPEDLRVEVVETVRTPSKKMNIRDAKVLVSGGRGMGKPENFELLEKVAQRLGGTVSASRAAVDAGWVPKDRQVGQTGQTVRPDLYLACGISGAIQHAAGMEESKLIVAINKDATAPMFQLADLGIVGDALTILPELDRLLAERGD